ncbi:hypothetical protein BJV82DRAFT_643925 [Fennellomyces sp. T-0311]|nr:hypothetical protein BJV82DRAFT_643925 [Fennellomyces sp. T-0311]
MPVFGGAPQCQRCNKSVYMAEQVIGPGGAYHRMCLTCKECNKRLDSTTLTERDNEAYCKVCYNRKWGPKGYGFASGAAFLSTESKMPKEILEEQGQSSPQLPPRPVSPVREETTESPAMSSFWSSRPVIPGTKPAIPGYVPKKVNIMVQNDTCTKCGKAVYAAELAMGAGNKYHKFCLKCTECGKLLSSTNMVDKDFDLLCRGCYAKLHGPKGFGYGNLLSTEGSTR